MTSSSFKAAIDAFDNANFEDPNTEVADGQTFPKELLYGQRMSEMQERYIPDASDAVKLAVRAQHIQRWKTPRSNYPMNKPGYMMWRSGLYKFHAETAGALMRTAGYDALMVERVKTIISKVGLKTDPETQQMEDVADLVFIEHYMTSFVAQHPDYDDAKWIVIVKKTWNKMSEAAHQFALSGKLKLPQELVPLILKAVQ